MAKYDQEFERTRRKLIKATIDIYDRIEVMARESMEDVSKLLEDPIDGTIEMSVDLLKSPETRAWFRAYSEWAEAVAERAMEA